SIRPGRPTAARAEAAWLLAGRAGAAICDHLARLARAAGGDPEALEDRIGAAHDAIRWPSAPARVGLVGADALGASLALVEGEADVEWVPLAGARDDRAACRR